MTCSAVPESRIVVRDDSLWTVSAPHPALGEPKTATTSDSGAGPNFFLWNAERGSSLLIGGADEVSLARCDDGLAVGVRGETDTVPLTAPQCRIPIDGQTLEIFTDTAVLAVGLQRPLSGSSVTAGRGGGVFEAV